MVTVSPFSTALISSGSLFLASATLTFISLDDSYLIWLCQLQRTGTGRSMTSDLNSDRGEAGGSSPPSPTIQITSKYAAILTPSTTPKQVSAASTKPVVGVSNNTFRR